MTKTFSYDMESLSVDETLSLTTMLITFSDKELLIHHIKQNECNCPDPRCMTQKNMKRAVILLNILINSDRSYGCKIVSDYYGKDDPSLDFLLKFVSGFFDTKIMLDNIESKKDEISEGLYIDEMRRIKDIYEVGNRYWIN